MAVRTSHLLTQAKHAGWQDPTEASTGWKDDTAWTRSTVACQQSLSLDGLLGCVVQRQDGQVTWSVQSLDNHRSLSSGTATTLVAARQRVEQAFAVACARLF